MKITLGTTDQQATILGSYSSDAVPRVDETVFWQGSVWRVLTVTHRVENAKKKTLRLAEVILIVKLSD